MPKAATNRYARTARTLLLAAIGTCSAFTAPGCATVRGWMTSPGGDLTATSLDGGKRLAPTFVTAAYHDIDENTADVYLSDLPGARFLDPRDSLADATGSVLHIHVFLVPQAGSTPIDPTACNVTVRHLVLAGPAGATLEATDTPRMGLYAGGGFLLPSGGLNEETIGGSLRDASHRLTRATPGFADLLGPGTLSGHFGARRDDDLARAMRTKLELLVARLPEATVEEEPAVKPKAAEDKSTGSAKGAGKDVAKPAGGAGAAK